MAESSRPSDNLLNGCLLPEANIKYYFDAFEMRNRKVSREQWKDALEAIGFIALNGSLVFLAIEIRTNTESNHIAIFENYGSNWIAMNGEIAGNRELAALIVKAYADEELDPVESRQFRGWVFQRVSQSNQMLRFYDAGLITEHEAQRAFRSIRAEAANSRFRAEIETLDNERLRGLILDENGLETLLNAAHLGRR